MLAEIVRLTPVVLVAEAVAAVPADHLSEMLILLAGIGRVIVRLDDQRQAGGVGFSMVFVSHDIFPQSRCNVTGHAGGIRVGSQRHRWREVTVALDPQSGGTAKCFEFGKGDIAHLRESKA